MINLYMFHKINFICVFVANENNKLLLALTIHGWKGQNGGQNVKIPKEFFFLECPSKGEDKMSKWRTSSQMEDMWQL